MIDEAWTKSSTALADADCEVAPTTGAVVERFLYTPYGEQTVLNGPADKDSGVSDWTADADNTSDYAFNIGFQGQQHDTESGLHHVRNRMYHPGTGIGGHHTY